MKHEQNNFNSFRHLKESNKTSALNITFLLVCFYIFLLIERPWESIRYLEGIPIQKTFAIIMIIVALLEGKFKIVKSITNKWVYGLLILHFVLIPFAFNPSFAYEQAIFYAKSVILYLLLISVIDSEYSLRLVVKVFIFSMMVYLIHSLWEYHNGRVIYRMGISRMVGVDNFLSDPNAFGASIVLSLPLVYSLHKTEDSMIFKLLYFGYFSIGTTCLILTGSRSAFACYIMLFVCYILLKKGIARIVFLSLSIIFLLFIWIYMPSEKKERIRTLWDKNAGPTSAHSSAIGRVYGWNASWEMFRRNPITGVGPGGNNFIGYRMTHNIHGGGPPSPTQSHILYGQILAEQGLFGAFLFIGLVCSIIKAAKSHLPLSFLSFDNNNFLHIFSIAIIVCVILLLFLGLAGHNFYRPLWLWLAAWSTAIHK